MAKWLAGLAALAVACVGLALWLGWWSAQLFHEMDVFYRGDNGGQEHPAAVYLYYDSISRNSYAMHDVQSPLMAGAVFAVFAFLAVLALRRERRDGRRL